MLLFEEKHGKRYALFLSCAVLVLATSGYGQPFKMKGEARMNSDFTNRNERKIIIEPDCFDFEEIPVGHTRRKVIKAYFEGGGDFGFPRLGFHFRCSFKPCISAYYPSTSEFGDSLAWSYVPGNNDTILIIAELTPADTISYCHSIVIKSNLSVSDSAVFSYGGLGIAAVPQFSSTFHDFGDVSIDRNATWNFTITNIGRERLKIEELSFRSGNYFSVTPVVDSIAPLGRQEFQLRFDPSEAGDYGDLLRLKSNALYGDDALRVKGRGFDGPGIAFEPATISFDTCFGTTQKKAVSVRNTGNGALSIFGIASPDSTNLPPPMINAPLLIPAGKNALVNFPFTPQSEATTSTSGLYRAYSNRNGGDNTLAVEAKARNADFRVVPTPALLKSITAVVMWRDSAAFYIDNPSTCPLLVKSIAVVPESSAFSISLDKITLPPRMQAPIWVHYRPTRVGRDTAKVIVQAEYFAFPETLQVYGESLPSATFALDSTQLRFGEVCVRKPTFKSVRVRNEGRTLMVIEDVIVGTSGVFAIYPKPSPTQPLRLGPQGEQFFAVIFRPQAPMLYDEVITFVARAEGEKNLGVRGQGFAAELQADSSVLSFGELIIADSLERSLVLRNRSKQEIVINRFELWPPRAPFSVSPQSATLTNLSDSLVIKVRFKPDAFGEHDAKLIIQHNVDCADDTISLTGAGRMPVQFTAPNRHDFDSVQVPRSRAWSFVFVNKSDSVLHMQIDYPAAPVFEVTKIPDRIVQDQSYPVQITFRPNELKSSEDSLVFFSTEYPRFRHRVDLIGIGVDTIGPVITFTPTCTIFNVGDAILLSAVFRDSVTRAQNQTLHYRHGGENNFIAQRMSGEGGDLWKGVVPGGFIAERGLDYFFSSQDDSGNSSQSPSEGFYSISVKLPEGITRPKTLHAGRTTQDYRMVSIPLILDEASSAEVLSINGLRHENREGWRCFDYHNGNLIQLTADNASLFRPFQPGRAFWLLIAGPTGGFQPEDYWEALRTKLVTRFRSGSGKTAAPGITGCPEVDKYHQLDLEPGWNMIANPFLYPLLKKQLRLVGHTTQIADNLMFYDGCWKSAPDTLQPWEGYAIKVGALAQLAFHDLAQPAKLPNEENGGGWRIQIIARSGPHEDAFNFAGVHPEAAMEWDGRDIFEPPTIGACISLAFPHREWAHYADLYAGDFRPAFSEGQVWEFEVKTNLKENWTSLHFKNDVSFPTHFGVYLYDKNRQVFQNLRERPDYGYTELGELLPGRFKLIVGTEAYLQPHLARVQETPTEFQLYQNFPNPFREETIFSFYLPETSPVWVKIYDVLGREVAVLSAGQTWGRGRNWLRWDGGYQNGIKGRSGVYILSIQTSRLNRQQRIVLIK